VVRPTWEDYESQPDDIVLVLDPGQAFGTGDHPTTRNCLVLLEGTPLQGKEIADIGCGSGILAIAAGQLGASLIHAVDVEGPSVAATAENAERNGVTLVVERGLGFDPLPAEQTYDVVVSNILSAALIALAPEVSRRLRTPGVWIVSGIIQANWPDVRTAAERYGFRLDETREEGEWVTARFVR
jgi:ribosomal protein L11 methyltransferase